MFESAEQVFLNRSRAVLLVGLVLAVAARVSIYFYLYVSGYFYGLPWDTFSRTDLSWQWAQRPYFSPADGYWVPLQFWIVGVTYIISRPFIGNSSNILVPVAVNNLFFVGSLVVTFLAARRMGGLAAALLALSFAVLFPADVFVSYSALAEPIYIFCILSVGLVLFNSFSHARTGQPRYDGIWLGIISLVASAAHFIGWLLSLFVTTCLLALTVLSLSRKQFEQTALNVLGVALCIFFPILWLTNNWLEWGDPLHFVRIASEYQSGYVGGIGIRQRFLMPLEILWQIFPALVVLGVLSAVLVIRKERRSAVYLAPAAFLFAMLWGATVLAFTNPYQEPRYMVVFGWALIPYVAALFALGWWESVWSKMTAAILALLILVAGLFGMSSFSNSFGPDVSQTAARAGQWLVQSANARVIIQSESFAESGVIPVVAGYPDRFIKADGMRLRAHSEDPAQYFQSLAAEWLAIVKDEEFANHAHSRGLNVEQVGAYFVISESK